MYKAKKIKTSRGEQWIVVSENGELSELPCRFLKHISAVGQSICTQKSYAYSLKYLSDYLLENNTKYMLIGMRELYGFTAWLQAPKEPNNAVRSPRAVNTYIAGVMSFYRYLYSIGQIKTNLDAANSMIVSYTGTAPKYKDFLYHTHKGKPVEMSRLKVREKRKKVKTLTSDEVKKAINSVGNIRDKFMIYLLFVSGLRIGEMLSLFNEDIIFDHAGGHRIQLKNRGALPNGGHLKTGERTVYVNQKCLDLYDDYQYEICESFERKSDFLFVKLSGKNKGEPLNYNDVMSLFRRIKKKTGLDIHPHLLRHTHATMFYAQTRNAKALQERLGHADIQTTLNTYVHPTNDDILSDWKRAASAFESGVI